MFDTGLFMDKTGALEDFKVFLAHRGIQSEQSITKQDINDYIIMKRDQAGDLHQTLLTICEYFLSVNNGVLSHEIGIYLEAGGHFNNLSRLTKSELGDSRCLTVVKLC